MASYNRMQIGRFGQWWWTVDRGTVMAVLALAAVGAIMVVAASPAVASRIDLQPMHFVGKHYALLALGLVAMVWVSLLSPLMVRRLAVAGLFGSMALMLLALQMGEVIKGAQRWVHLGGFSIQPSEFLKPCFVVVNAWLLAERQRRVSFPGYGLSLLLFGVVVLLLVAQPDFGMTLTFAAVWAGQLFLSGISLWIVVGLIGAGVIGSVGAYFGLDHVRRRIDSFLDPTTGDNYQIEKSLEAYRAGGFLGQGPGEGSVKHSLPDAHTDFIMSVMAEEFGTLVCILVVFLFGIIVVRGLLRLRQADELYTVLAVSGLLIHIGVQAVINMGVSVQLLPAKGMTLPFISYGGSSAVATALGFGMLLALTRKRYGTNELKREREG